MPNSLHTFDTDMARHMAKDQKPSGREALDEAKYIASLCKAGKYTYDEAKKEMEPFLEIFNREAGALARKFKQKWSPLTITKLLR